ncbi:Bro-N domain-containing protein [Pseudomonas sp. LJDD11]|uniref:BRO-N domain-containing protein n=1 Tax=Pseudomonas sp. LJDD11 TaxID=2931984 RepID=UPI00211B8C2E|nr:Bro-N domain-containing protein [Pseudomonas sp. LJDD11]MCQ9424085.1 Bro-N domain-containing protein [Pseudomonas sp. LJDD11]
MTAINPNNPCTEHFEAIPFIRHHRQLRTTLSDGQAWFCLSDLARLMGWRLDERSTLKLDPDQRRTAWLETFGDFERCTLVSESGVFALLVHHYVPENRTLRRWLTHEVLPELHRRHDRFIELPSVNSLDWLGNSLQLLHWRNESWVRWKDMPGVLVEMPERRSRSLWRRVLRWVQG